MSDRTNFLSINKIIIFQMLLLAAGVVAGALGTSSIDESQTSSLQNYFNGFFGGVGPDNNLIFSSIKKCSAVWLLISSAGFMLPGVLITAAVVLRRGFVTGYTAACFCKIYGLKGALACSALLPESLVFLPAIIIFSSFSLKMSLSTHESKKLSLKNYLICCTVFLAIFCIVALLQTYVTTTFMKITSALL